MWPFSGHREKEEDKGCARVVWSSPQALHDTAVTVEEAQLGDVGSYDLFTLRRTGWAWAHPAPSLSSLILRT